MKPTSLGKNIILKKKIRPAPLCDFGIMPEATVDVPRTLHA